MCSPQTSAVATNQTELANLNYTGKQCYSRWEGNAKELGTDVATADYSLELGCVEQ